jgi:hypothetical protein
MKVIALIIFGSLLLMGCASVPTNTQDSISEELVSPEVGLEEQDLVPHTAFYPNPPEMVLSQNELILPLPSLAPMHIGRKQRIEPMDVVASSRPIPMGLEGSAVQQLEYDTLPVPRLDQSTIVVNQPSQAEQSNRVTNISIPRTELPLISLPDFGPVIEVSVIEPESEDETTEEIAMQPGEDSPVPISQAPANQASTTPARASSGTVSPAPVRPAIVTPSPTVPTPSPVAPFSIAPTPVAPTPPVVVPPQPLVGPARSVPPINGVSSPSQPVIASPNRTSLPERRVIETSPGESLSIELEGFGWMLSIEIPNPTNQDFPQELRSSDWNRYGFRVNQEFFQRGMRFTLESDNQAPRTFALVFRRTSLADGFAEEKIYDVLVPSELAAINLPSQLINYQETPRAIGVSFLDDSRAPLVPEQLQGTYQSQPSTPTETDRLELRFSGLPEDERLFRMAGEYELQRTSGSLRRSLELYRELVQRFPFSDYTQQASTRMRVLERQFSMIR